MTKFAKVFLSAFAAASCLIGWVWWVSYAVWHLNGWTAFPVAMTGSMIMVVAGIGFTFFAISESDK